MIKKLLFILPLLLLGTMAMHIDSNSAPASTSGAPGEVDCTTSGCHQSFLTNSGQGNTSIIFENGITTYIPGKTYTLTFEITQPALIRFGFQMTAIKDADSSNAGTLKVIDGTRNQIVSGYNKFSNRKYMTYTFKSTAATKPGKASWTFNWTAPLVNEGPVTFYVAGIAANNDGNDLGDYCYTTSLKIMPETPVVYNTNPVVTIFPNPVTDKINIKYFLNEESNVKIDIVDLNGQKIEELLSSMQKTGDYNLSLTPSKLTKGSIYFIRITTNDKKIVNKIFIYN